jgi:hypothetical protein
MACRKEPGSCHIKISIKRYCPAGTKVGQNWYQSNRKDKLYCRNVSFTMPKGTPPREEHKRTWRVYIPRAPVIDVIRQESMDSHSPNPHTCIAASIEPADWSSRYNLLRRRSDNPDLHTQVCLSHSTKGSRHPYAGVVLFDTIPIGWVRKHNSVGLTPLQRWCSDAVSAQRRSIPKCNDYSVGAPTLLRVKNCIFRHN